MATVTGPVMENVVQLKKERVQLRRAFTKASKELESLLKEKPERTEDISISFRQLEGKSERLFAADGKLREAFLTADLGDEEMEQEYDSQELYRDEFIKYKTKAERFLNQRVTGPSDTSQRSLSNIEEESVGESKRKFRLPMLELKKFDGDVRNWIGFWGQFKKIDQDKDIDQEDKFQYLMQATEPKSAARKLVEGFPPSGENYSKAINQLKNRFAKDEFLIEVYVRELLDLVLQQSIKGRSGMSLSHLFDKLETQLRALETLGVTSDKYAAMLYPLAESALPGEILKAWERHRSLQKTEGEASDSTNRLNLLLDFLRSEVESEERINLVRTSFSARKDSDRTTDYKVKRGLQENFEMSTAATIFTSNKNEGKKLNNFCIFCEKPHSSQDCIKAQSFTIEEKRNIIAKKNCCFGCLKPNHSIKKCRIFLKCIICGKKHFPIMCPNLHTAESHENRTLANNVGSTSNSENVLISNVRKETLLQTVLVLLIHKNRTRKVRALLDSGSQRSYVLTDCAEKMNFNKIGEESLIQGVFGGIESKARVHTLYDVHMQSLDCTFNTNVTMLGQKKICNYVPRLQNIECIEYLKQKNIILSDVGPSVPEIEILIGADIIGNLLTGRMEKFDNTLFAMETHLGWTVFGQCLKEVNSIAILSCFSQHTISELWSLEVLGISDPAAVKSKEDHQAMVIKDFTETISVNQDRRYEVRLPWIENRPQLGSNLEIAQSRLLTVTKKLVNLGNFEGYENVFQEWLKLGIIEEVPLHELHNSAHYLPHHAVFKESSLTTKIRPVFDASAKDRMGHSLNDCLEKGPNLIEEIPSLLLEFRMRSIGVTSDIAKAFLQISLAQRDRDYLRFLWWDDYSKQKMKYFRHCRVVFGVSSSPFLLAASINYHLKQAPVDLMKTASKLKSSFYVDNCVTSVSNEQELKKFISESKELMSLGQFDLRSWVHSFMVPNSDTNGQNVVSVLGLTWNFQEDTLFCDLKSISQLNSISFTKRGLLSIAHKIFDPIGFTSPVTLIPKILLREIWNLKIGWDTPLPKVIEKQYIAWHKDISWVTLCHIPRILCRFNLEDSDCSIHVFCDASKAAYATCIFIRVEKDREIAVQLLQAKTRIAPPKAITLPRLELLAALIGVRLCQSVKKIDFFNSLKTYYWSDSMVVLAWIKSEGIWNVFVGNRIKEIHSVSNREDWNHVPGMLNPADLPSRGCSGKYLFKSKWWMGPRWLYGPKDTWPRTDVIETGEEVENERKNNTLAVIACENSNITNKFNHFSQYTKIVRMIGWMLRFYLKIKTADNKLVGEISYSEFKEAEERLLRMVQVESFLEYSKEVTNLRNLQIFKDEKGLLRVRTKLSLLDDKEDFKYPILLPSVHDIVFKLVSEQHRLNHHAGVQTLLCILRERFWILKGRKTVQQILRKCVICKRYSQKVTQTPFAPLPKNRVKDAAVFEVTGIDFAGPLFLKGGEKAWVVLFTCAIYRAVHLELVTSLSTDAFIKALRRFIARRGRISVIYSDNGTNFVGTNNFLKMICWDEIVKYSTVGRIKWIFNPPTAAWWGGWWERIIRVVKELLKRNLGKASVNYEELITILCDCEAVINARPLTYLPSEEELLPLTPAHFIQNITNGDIPDLDTIDRTFLLRRHRYVQCIREKLRQRFRKEYLAELVHFGRRKVSRIQVGDIVLLGSDNTKRINWPIARVLEVYPGRDNIPRVARIKTGDGMELVRPFQRLYPLEVIAAEDNFIASQRKSIIPQFPSNSTPPEISKEGTSEEGSKAISAKNAEITTRSGRVVKQPERF